MIRNDFPEPGSKHFVSGRSITPPFPEGMNMAMFGMGCFWGAEKLFWQSKGVYVTMVGYTGGQTEKPTYQAVCSGTTGHSEVVRVVYDAAVISYDDLLKLFWENHDPTQVMRQGADVGTQYRTGIYYYDEEQKSLAGRSRMRYQLLLDSAGYGKIATEILPAPTFYYAETDHQQYLAANPGGYCGHGGTGVCLA